MIQKANMTQQIQPSPHLSTEADEDGRAPYLKPELLDRGSVAEQTRFGAAGAQDGDTYS